MDFRGIAARVASTSVEAARRRKKPMKPKLRSRKVSQPKAARPRRDDMLSPSTEISCHADMSISATFEGDVSEPELIKRMKKELQDALSVCMKDVANFLGIQATGVLVKPIKVQCALNDQTSINEDIEAEY